MPEAGVEEETVEQSQRCPERAEAAAELPAAHAQRQLHRGDAESGSGRAGSRGSSVAATHRAPG